MARKASESTVYPPPFANVRPARTRKVTGVVHGRFVRRSA